MKQLAVFAICIFIILGLGCTGHVSHKGVPVMDESTMRQLVLDVIKENPQVVYEAVSDYARSQKEQARLQELERSFSKRVKISVDASDPVKGPANAVITIVEFTDFQCPYCARGAGVMDDLLQQYAGKVKLVFKNNPLKFHELAVPAAKAALAAHQQGKFWPFSELLFDNSNDLTSELFVTIAEQLGLDMKRFNRDRDSDQIARRIATDRQQAVEHGFTAAPTFVINGVVVVGAQRLDYFKTVVDRLLNEAG